MVTVKFMKVSKIRNMFIFLDIEDVASVGPPGGWRI